MFVRPAPERELVRNLDQRGWNRCQISRMTGIPRSTVRDWLNPALQRRPRSASRKFRSLLAPTALIHEWNERAYSYLLGLYLGDGHIFEVPGGARLTLALDRLYPRIASSALRDMHLARCFPAPRSSFIPTVERGC